MSTSERVQNVKERQAKAAIRVRKRRRNDDGCPRFLLKQLCSFLRFPRFSTTLPVSRIPIHQQRGKCREKEKHKLPRPATAEAPACSKFPNSPFPARILKNMHHICRRQNSFGKLTRRSFKAKEEQKISNKEQPTQDGCSLLLYISFCLLLPQ